VKAKAVGYWVSTGLVAFTLIPACIFQVSRNPQSVEGFAHLGYPVYFVMMLGVWKGLGAMALLAPGMPRVKEWAYAGVFFDYTSATVSHAASGDSVFHIVAPLVCVGILYASWALRPPSRLLANAARG
jgi:hypothetical protein